METKSIYDITRDGYTIYGSYVNNFRHLPLIFDGLKPSYRRTIFGALTLCGGSNKFIKTSQLSGYVIGNLHPHGNCIAGDTLIYSVDGKLRKIKDLYESGVDYIDTISYDENLKDFVPSQAQLFRLGAVSKVKYRIEINGKYTIECTGNHKFLTAVYLTHRRGGLDIDTTWLQADQLKIGMYLNSASIHNGFLNSPIRSNWISSIMNKNFRDPIWEELGCCIVTKVERIELDEEEQFYDFTVDGYNSMMIPLNSDLDNLQLINVHNSSVEGVIAELVHAGIFEGQGNFGGATMLGDKFEPAAPRYTECRLDPKWHSIFNELLPYVEWEDSYIGVRMPSYLPTPISLSFIFGSQGIGFGTGCVIPNFTSKSLVEAFKSNDPYKLVPSYNDVVFKMEKCDFENMWNFGYARMTYGPIVTRGRSGDCSDGIYVKCDPRFMIPKMPLIEEKVMFSRLFVRDESDENGNKLFIGRYPKMQENMDKYAQYIKDTVEISDTYRLFVTNGKVTRLISLKDWIKFTYGRYLGYINKMKQTKISRIDKEIRVLSILPKIGDLIHENRNITKSEIISKFPEFDPSDINACLAKPISKLMKGEHNAEIESLTKSRKSIESIDPEVYTSNILSKM